MFIAGKVKAHAQVGGHEKEWLGNQHLLLIKSLYDLSPPGKNPNRTEYSDDHLRLIFDTNATALLLHALQAPLQSGIHLFSSLSHKNLDFILIVTSAAP